MQKLVKLLFAAMLVLGCTGLHAQKAQKLGHVDFNALLLKMPGMDSAQTKLQDYAKTLKGQLETMQNEYDSKVNDYQSTAVNLPDTDPIKKTKEKEILDLRDRIQAFNSSANESMQNKETELTQPIIDKAHQAVKDVAKENGYTYILNTSEGMGVVLSFENGEDVTPLVKKKLGLK